MRSAGFNPKARWDRHIPTEENHEPDTLDERIDCLALFQNTVIKPRAFFWKDKLYRIKKITYTWQERRGREVINFFSVTTGPDMYQISFNNTTYRWQIDKIIT